MAKAMGIGIHAKTPPTDYWNDDPYPASAYERFPRELVHDTIKHLQFVRRTEADLEKFCRSEMGGNTLYMRPMDYERRWIVHQMAPHYGIQAETVDKGSNRAVRLLKSGLSHPPKALLSNGLEAYKQNEMDDNDNPRPWPYGCMLSFTDLKDYVNDELIHQQLARFRGQYRLFWRSEFTCYAVFETPKQMRKAYNALRESRYPCRMTAIRDEPTVERCMGDETCTQKPSALPPAPLERESSTGWREDVKGTGGYGMGAMRQPSPVDDLRFRGSSFAPSPAPSSSGSSHRKKEDDWVQVPKKRGRKKKDSASQSSDGW